MNRALGLVSAAGFLASGGVHIAAISGIDVSSSVPVIWPMHLGAILIFGIFVILARRISGLGAIQDCLPTSVVISGALILLLAFSSSLAGFVASGDGNAEVIDGAYVIASHGRVVSRVSQTEYQLHQASEQRAFSGLWMVFYLLPMLYFIFWRPREASTGSSG